MLQVQVCGSQLGVSCVESKRVAHRVSGFGHHTAPPGKNLVPFVTS